MLASLKCLLSNNLFKISFSCKFLSIVILANLSDSYYELGMLWIFKNTNPVMSSISLAKFVRIQNNVIRTRIQGIGKVCLVFHNLYYITGWKWIFMYMKCSNVPIAI